MQKTKAMIEIIKNQLRNRTISQLKNDIYELQKSEEEGSTMVFVFALDILEERLTDEKYKEFENTL